VFGADAFSHSTCKKTLFFSLTRKANQHIPEKAYGFFCARKTGKYNLYHKEVPAYFQL
jgi:hypothetical protein